MLSDDRIRRSLWTQDALLQKDAIDCVLSVFAGCVLSQDLLDIRHVSPAPGPCDREVWNKSLLVPVESELGERRLESPSDLAKLSPVFDSYPDHPDIGHRRECSHASQSDCEWRDVLSSGSDSCQYFL